MVGDPSGQDRAAPDADPWRNRGQPAGLEPQVGASWARRRRALVVNNADWLLPLSYIEFLRDIGRHFSVNQMLAAEAYKMRLEKGLSFIEFNYQLLQAYDFLVLHGVRLHPPDRRRRPVGQHPGRHRPHPPGRPEGGLRADLPAADHRLRREDGQDRRRGGLAVGRADLASSTSTSTGSTSTTAT